MDADRHRDSDNETDGNHPSETSTTFAPSRSIPSLGQEEVSAATLKERDEATVAEREETTPWPSSSRGDGRAPKRKRQPSDEALIAAPATRGSTFNDPRVALLDVPAATVAEPTATYGAASLNAPGVVVESLITHRGSQLTPASSSQARMLGSVDSQPQQQQLLLGDEPLFSPHNFGTNADHESALLQPRPVQLPGEQHGSTLRPPPVSTHFTSQLQPHGAPPFAPVGSTFQPVAEEKQSSPTFRQSLSPKPNSTSTLAILHQQQEQQRQQQEQQRQFRQQRQQQLFRQQERHVGTAASANLMAPVTGTIATGDVATAAATSMRSALSRQPLPLGGGHIRNRRISRAEPSTLSPIEAMLWSNRVNSLTVPTSATASLPTSNTWSPPTPSQQNIAVMSLPRTTMGRHPRSTTEQHLNPFYRQQSVPLADSASQHVAGSLPFAAMNEERQSTTARFRPLLSDSTSLLTARPGNVAAMSEAQQSSTGSQQLSSSLVDSISQLATWPRYDATMSEEQQSTAAFGQSHTTASALAFLYQQQQQQEQRQHMRETTVNQRLAAPFDTATDAPAVLSGSLVNRAAATTTTANMRFPLAFEGPMANNPMPQPSQANLLPQETLYWPTHPSSQTMPTTSQQLPESWSPLTIPQLGTTGVSLPSLTVAQHHSQIPPRSSDLQAGFSSLPLTGNASSASWPVSQRALWNAPSIATVAAAATTDAASSATTEAVRAATDPIMTLPAFLAFPSDSSLMSEHQTYLRCHIQVFCASMEDAKTPMRGRIKKIRAGQVGLQCCHCARLPMTERINGAVYFPATTNGIYQASLNMGAMHLQCGRCPNMPKAMKQHFAELLGTKNIHSIVGRKYWAKRAIEMFGLVDTEDGIFVGKSTTPATLGVK